jgi:6-pyruvoyl-tetrahydropterin synthase
MWIVAEFEGRVNAQGVLLGMEFGDVKQVFRHHIDTTYDHHLLLNGKDKLLIDLGTNNYEAYYPGLCECTADPTTENIARWIGEWAAEEFGVPGLHRVRIEVWETQTNSATWEVSNAGITPKRTVS